MKRRLVVGLLLALGVLPSSARADVPMEARPARPASDVTDGFGVIAHLAYGNTPYVTQFSQVAQRLVQLGVKRIRTRLYPTNPGQVQRMLTLCNNHGIKFNVVVGTPTSNDVAAIHDLVATTLAGCVESVEGGNEWNLSGRANWANEVFVHQREIWETFRGDPRTAALPILAPALGKTIEADFQELGATGVSQYSSWGNIHLYPGGRIPSDRLSETLDWERQYVLRGNTAKFIATTEAGYHNAMSAPDGGHVPTSEKAAGIYHPRLLMEHLTSGARKMYNYEFLDQELDQVDPEHNFGLIRNDLSLKPSFSALRNTLSVFQDTVRAAAGTLTYGIESAVPVQHAAFRMSDGSFIVALWRDVSVYDRTARTDVLVEPVPVTLRLQQAAWVTTYRPSVQEAPMGTSSVKVTARGFQMPGDLYLIHIHQ